MKAFFDAIKSRYDGASGASLRALNPGGLWRERAPQKQAYPFIVMHDLGGGQKDTFGEYLNHMTVQFTTYDDSPSSATIEGIAAALMTLFDWCALTITGYTHIVMQRTFQQSFWNDEQQIWQYVVHYYIEAQKT